MAGHSKWANIRFRKSVQDAKRGKLFTKFIREITTAARQGGGDPESNPRLRTAIDKALAANMTRDAVDRAIKRGVGNHEGAAMEEVRYEGYGPAGVAIMVDCLTDNRNRTVSEVRHAFTKFGGNLGMDGSVSYLFSHVGLLTFPSGVSENDIIEIALDQGADDVQTDADGNIEVCTPVQYFQAIKDNLHKVGLEPERAEITYIASNSITLDKEVAERLMKLIDALEDLDDVQMVYSNAEISEDTLTALS